MNKNLNEAIFDIEKADAIMYAIEATYLDLDVVKEELELKNRSDAAFYALWDYIRKARADLDKLYNDYETLEAIKVVSEIQSAEE